MCIRDRFNAAPLTEQGGSYKYLIGGIGYKILNEREVSVTGLAEEYNVIQIPATVDVYKRQLLKVESIKKYPEDTELLEDVIIENKQAIEMANIYSCLLYTSTVW